MKEFVMYNKRTDDHKFVSEKDVKKYQEKGYRVIRDCSKTHY